MNYRNSLFIGLGGSGAKSILHAKAYFKNKGKEIPENVKFLAIDTDPAVLNETVISSYGEVVKILRNEFLHLENSPTINTFHNRPDYFEYLPKGAEIFLGAGPGAKQIRSMGLSRLQANYDRAFTDISNKINGIISFTNPADDGIVNVSIITSIAGGTGSGTFIAINAIVRRILGENSKINLYAITPDVFTHSGDTNPAFANIYQNSYAAMMELEMLESTNLDVFLSLPDGTKLNLRAKSPDYIYTVTNRIGDFTINDANKVYELVGKSLFTTAGALQDRANSVFNNVDTQRATPGNNVMGKANCAMGVGVAEIEFDSNYLANIFLNRYKSVLISSLLKCEENLIEPTVENIVTKNQFKEDNGFDMLIDSLLDPQPSIASFAAANNNTISAMVDNFIVSDITSKEKSIANKLKTRKESIKNELKKDFNDIFKSHGVECAIKIIEAIIARTKNSFVKEMSEEAESLISEVESIKMRLDSEIQNFQGISGLFTTNRRNDSFRNIQLFAQDYVLNKAEILRRNNAIEFYNHLISMLNEELDVFNRCKQRLIEISNESTSIVRNLINVSNKKISEFTINLHLDYINASFVNPKVEDVDDKAFMLNINLDQFITDSKERISTQIDSFIKDKAQFKEVLNKNIKSMISQLIESKNEKVVELIRKIVRNSSPSWNTNAIRDYVFPQPLLDLFIIGVGDNGNSIFNNKDFDSLFLNTTSIDGNNRDIVSTGDFSRIIFFRIQSMRPLFVLHGVDTWREKYLLQKSSSHTNDSSTLPHLTKQWQDYVDNNFYDLFPANKQNDPRKVWVAGIIYELIKRDESGYRVKSLKKGEPINEFMVNLGINRKDAYDKFVDEKYYLELDLEIAEFEKMITEFKRNEFENKIKDLTDYRDVHSLLEVSFEVLSQRKDSDQLMNDIYKMLNEEMSLIHKEKLF
jgi:hypothetical protein